MRNFFFSKTINLKSSTTGKVKALYDSYVVHFLTLATKQKYIYYYNVLIGLILNFIRFVTILKRINRLQRLHGGRSK